MTEKDLIEYFDFPTEPSKSKRKKFTKREFISSAKKLYEILKAEGKYDNDYNGTYKTNR